MKRREGKGEKGMEERGREEKRREKKGREEKGREGKRRKGEVERRLGMENVSCNLILSISIEDGHTSCWI